VLWDTQQIGTALLTATALGVSLAGGCAIAGPVLLHWSNGPFLRWAILPILPIAVAILLTAVLATRWGRIPATGWHVWLDFPAESVAFAAAGMVLVQLSVTASVFPSQQMVNGLVGRLGALLLGIGVALVVARRPRYRLILAAPLGVFAAGIVTGGVTGVLACLYIAAATGWWWQRVWQLASRPRGLLPHVRP
jgi:hypothetical protein